MLLVVRGEAQHVEDVTEHRGLDLSIQGRRIVKRGADIYLNQPWVQLLINEDVEPIEFIEVVAVVIARSIDRLHRGLDRNESLDNDVFDPPKNFVGIDSEFFVLGSKGFEGPFVSILIVVSINILDEHFGFFVNTEVGKVSEPVIET